MQSELPKWLKNKGYIHLTPQIDIKRNSKSLIKKIYNRNFVAHYGFYPLIHSMIKERKYKKKPNSSDRGHSYRNVEGQTISSAKNRPLHYSSHLDALIFGYYSELLQKKYESILEKNMELSKCVTAYRRIPIPETDKNKSTIHFAKEAFDEIKKRSVEKCTVLMFDVKSFFPSIDHQVLKEAWINLLEERTLPPDHLNVYNAATKFSYILKDELRIKQSNSHGRRFGFNEKRLAEIRKEGKFCYFGSPKDFREAIKSKELKLYRFPFKKGRGIPQGLAISTILANVYLLDFDKIIYDVVVKKMGGYYRRYSDDILIICEPEQAIEIKELVYRAIEKSKLTISKEKNEEYEFQKMQVGKEKYRINSAKIIDKVPKVGIPLTYLGFEFYGEKVLIKSANLAKFYRRMINAIKIKANRAKKSVEKSPHSKLAVFRNQLIKLYTIQDLNVTKIRTSINKLVKNDKGYYDLRVIKITKPLKSNYISYVDRVCQIMNDKSPKNQIKKHKTIFNQAIAYQLKKVKSDK